MDDIGAGSVQGEVTDAPGPNPAWNDVLSVLPEQFHSVVTPHFQKWDTAANQRVESVNAQLKAFEPYSQFVEHGIDVSELENGLRLMYEINNNPQRVWDALGSAYGLAGQQNANGNGVPENANEPQQQQLDPRVDELQQGINLVSQIILNEQRAKFQAQADSELDTELKQLREKHGDYDERYVLTMMDNGFSGDEAIASFNELRNNLLRGNPRPFAPTVMGNNSGGAGLPSNAIDPTKLSGKETRNLVAEMLAAEFGPRR